MSLSPGEKGVADTGVEEKPAFGASRPHKKKTVKRYAGTLWGIKALTGMLHASPALKGGDEGSFLKIDY